MRVRGIEDAHVLLLADKLLRNLDEEIQSCREAGWVLGGSEQSLCPTNCVSLSPATNARSRASFALAYASAEGIL